jgi:hypothetical protein
MVVKNTTVVGRWNSARNTTQSVLGISDLDAALSLAGKGGLNPPQHDDGGKELRVMAFAVTPVDSAEDRIVLVVQPGPKYVYSRSQIEAEKLVLRQAQDAGRRALNYSAGHYSK